MTARGFGKTRAEATVARFAAAGKACFNSALFHTTVASAAFVCGAMPLANFVFSQAIIGARKDVVSFGCYMLSAAALALKAFRNRLSSDFVGILQVFGMMLFMASPAAAKHFFGAGGAKSTCPFALPGRWHPSHSPQLAMSFLTTPPGCFSQVLQMQALVPARN